MVNLPIGTIILFYGSSIPNGWLLCDGNNNTPNLIDRFVLGGKLDDCNLSNSRELSGNQTTKQIMVDTSTSTVSITGNTGDTSLTVEQIPSHTHDLGLSLSQSAVSKYSINNEITANGYWQIYCSKDNGSVWYTDSGHTGSGKSHSHKLSLTSGEHEHNVNVIPPYTIMAYIIYVGGAK
ncbi:hypothetical protein GKR55_07100 [Providencia stuartii]|nr:tail fiber protein [Providencia stuartii]MTB80311.1 hypothetical protein [Providencia stuartii]